MTSKQPFELPAPQQSAPVEEGVGRIILTLGGKRYEVAIKVQARELPETPSVSGILIEMPSVNPKPA